MSIVVSVVARDAVRGVLVHPLCRSLALLEVKHCLARPEYPGVLGHSGRRGRGRERAAREVGSAGSSGRFTASRNDDAEDAGDDDDFRSKAFDIAEPLANSVRASANDGENPRALPHSLYPRRFPLPFLHPPGRHSRAFLCEYFR